MSENSCCLVKRGLIILSMMLLAHGFPKPTALQWDITNRHAHWATWVSQHEWRPRGLVLCSGAVPTSCIPDHKAIILISTEGWRRWSSSRLSVNNITRGLLERDELVTAGPCRGTQRPDRVMTFWWIFVLHYESIFTETLLNIFMFQWIDSQWKNEIKNTTKL